MNSSIRLTGHIFLCLVFLVSCFNSKNEKEISSKTHYKIGEIISKKVGVNDKSNSSIFYPSSFVNDQYKNLYVTLNHDLTLRFVNRLGETISTFQLKDSVPLGPHQFFGDPETGLIYSTSFRYYDQYPDFLYKYDLNTGEVTEYPAEVDFTPYGERFGFSLISQYGRNDTFFLCFGYPYINGGPDRSLRNNLWNVPHLGLAKIDNDSVKFIKGFGVQIPKLAAEHVWKRPSVEYIPERNEILFSYYFSDTTLIYNFNGDLIHKVPVHIEGFDKSAFIGSNYKPGCFENTEWYDYLKDSVIYFNEVGFNEKKGMYYKTINFPHYDDRNVGVVFFDKNGNEELLYSFKGEAPFVNFEKDGIYQFSNAYDSLHYRVSKYDVYDYPEGFFNTETVLRDEN